MGKVDGFVLRAGQINLGAHLLGAAFGDRGAAVVVPKPETREYTERA